MEKTVESVLFRVSLREVGGGREAPGVRTEREGELSSVRVSARVPSSQLDVGRMEVSLCFFSLWDLEGRRKCGSTTPH